MIDKQIEYVSFFCGVGMVFMGITGAIIGHLKHEEINLGDYPFIPSKSTVLILPRNWYNCKAWNFGLHQFADHFGVWLLFVKCESQ